MKKFDEFINEADIAFSDLKLNTKVNKTDLKKIYLKKIGREGKLSNYIENKQVKFGMLKAIYDDAISYKKTREYEKGVAKFAVRAIPMALGPVFFPIWLISQILGATRALNKIIIPALNMEHANYKSFITNLITRTMNLAEGDIRPFLGKDWYYDIFYIHDGLIKMVRKEYIYEFAIYISEIIHQKDDNEIVPKYWLDNEFRKWLNEKFDIDLPTGKRMKKRYKRKS